MHHPWGLCKTPGAAAFHSLCGWSDGSHRWRRKAAKMAVHPKSLFSSFFSSSMPCVRCMCMFPGEGHNLLQQIHNNTEFRYSNRQVWLPVCPSRLEIFLVGSSWCSWIPACLCFISVLHASSQLTWWQYNYHRKPRYWLSTVFLSSFFFFSDPLITPVQIFIFPVFPTVVQCLIPIINKSLSLNYSCWFCFPTQTLI